MKVENVHPKNILLQKLVVFTFFFTLSLLISFAYGCEFLPPNSTECLNVTEPINFTLPPVNFSYEINDSFALNDSYSLSITITREVLWTGWYLWWRIGNGAYVLKAILTYDGKPVTDAEIVAEISGPKGEKYWFLDGSNELHDIVRAEGQDQYGKVIGPWFGGGIDDGIYTNFLELSDFYFGHWGSWVIRIKAFKDGVKVAEQTVILTLYPPVGDFGQYMKFIDLDISTQEPDWAIYASPGQEFTGKIVYDETRLCAVCCVFYIRAWGAPYEQWGKYWNIDNGCTTWKSNVVRYFTWKAPSTYGNYTLTLNDVFAYWWPFYGESIFFVGRVLVKPPLYCGDNICSPEIGESFETCPEDCPKEIKKVAYIPVRFVGPPEPFHTIDELKERAKQVSDYYRQQSYSAVKIDNKFIFDEWKSLNKTLSYYECPWWKKIIPWLCPSGYEDEKILEDAIKLSGIDVNQYDGVIVIQPAGFIRSFNIPSTPKILSTEKRIYATWAHELGHAIFKWEDYYENKTKGGNIHYWGLMGRATLANPPSPIMSYNKEKAKWLSYLTLQPHEFGEYPINLLKELKFGDYVRRYKTKHGPVKYYIFEGRYPWDNVEVDRVEPDPTIYNWGINVTPLETIKGVLLYQVEEKGIWPWKWEEVYTIPFNNTNYNRVTLPPNISYNITPLGVRFSVYEKDSKLFLNISNYTPIQKVSFTLFNTILKVFRSASYFSGEASMLDEPYDVDLHVYTTDGRHVGVNYQTGEYEVEILGAETSGDILGGGYEWISFPANEEVYAIIDAREALEWAKNYNLTVKDFEITVNSTVVYWNEKGIRVESRPFTVKVDLEKPKILALEAIVNIDPDTLNLKSKGRWITAYIELPEGYHPKEIDRTSIAIVAVNDKRLTQPIYAEAKPTQIGDYDNDGIPELMVKFDRAKLQKVLQKGDIKLTIAGKLFDLIPFEGSDKIRVISSYKFDSVILPSVLAIEVLPEGYIMVCDLKLNNENYVEVIRCIGCYSKNILSYCEKKPKYLDDIIPPKSIKKITWSGYPIPKINQTYRMVVASYDLETLVFGLTKFGGIINDTKNLMDVANEKLYLPSFYWNMIRISIVLLILMVVLYFLYKKFKS